MSLFWSKDALFWSEMHHMLSYSVVLYCTVFYCIAWYIFCYLLVLHGIALYDLVSYVIYFAYFCVFRFVARALSRKTPIPSIHPSGSAHPSDSFGSSGSADPSESIHPSHLDHPAHPAQSTHPACYLLFVICHLSFVIWYFLFAICLFVICCIVVYCIAWYIFCYLMVLLHGIALYDLVSYIIDLAIACFCVFRFVARAVSRKTPIWCLNLNVGAGAIGPETDFTLEKGWKNALFMYAFTTGGPLLPEPSCLL